MECVPILICHLSNTRIPKHALARIFWMTHQPSANKSKRPNTNQTYELPLPTFNFKTVSFPPRSSTSKNHGTINYTPNNCLHLLPMFFFPKDWWWCQSFTILAGWLGLAQSPCGTPHGVQKRGVARFSESLGAQWEKDMAYLQVPGIPRVSCWKLVRTS